MKRTNEYVRNLLMYYRDLYTRVTVNTEERLLAGICNIKLERFKDARDIFEEATKLNIKLIPQIKSIYFPWEVVATWVFSGNSDHAKDIWRILDHYMKNDYAAYAPLAKYSYITTEFLSPRGLIVDGWIEDLIGFEKKKIKDLYTLGYCFKAIQSKDLELFKENMTILLAKHHNIVRFGSLRETAEGFYCIEGMVLCYCALTSGMEIRIENEYISMDYLFFLRNQVCKASR